MKIKYMKKQVLTRINGKFILLMFDGKEESLKKLHPETIKWISDMIEKDFSWGGFFVMDGDEKNWGGSWETTERHENILKKIPEHFIYHFYMSGATSLLEASKEYYKSNSHSEGINELYDMMVILEDVINKEEVKNQIK